MAVEIRETTVTPMANGYGVQLRISDAPTADVSAAFELLLNVQIPAQTNDQLIVLQRAAMRMATAQLRSLIGD